MCKLNKKNELMITNYHVRPTRKERGCGRDKNRYRGRGSGLEKRFRPYDERNN